MSRDDDEIQSVFEAFDKDGSGELSVKELGRALRSLGHFMSKQEIKKLLRDNDEDGSGTLDISEFTQMVNALDDGDEEVDEHCPEGHPFARRTTAPPTYSGGAVACNVCGSTVDLSQGFLHCSECEYDKCANCAKPSSSQPSGTKCAKGHDLQRTTRNPPQYKGCSASCDKCGTTIAAADGIYHCDTCSYDLCHSCGTPATPSPSQPAPPPAPAPSSTKRGLKALFVGINYPGTSAALRGCVNDVRTMMRLLEFLKIPIRETRILVDDPNMKNRHGEPTKANMEEGMRWLVEGNMPGDTLFFHYSGHGSQQEGSTTEADGKDETLVPSDYNRSGMIVDDFIKATLVDTLRQGVTLTSVMDCCHSGSMFDLPYTFAATRQNLASARATNILSKGNDGPVLQGDVVMISGCKDDQTSADVQSSSGAGGACTNALAEVLGEHTDVTVVDLLDNMLKVLKQQGHTQIPQLSSSKPISTSTPFYFARGLKQ
eukprot:PhF_6_TR29290/c0_g1_i1/m.42926